MTRIIGGRAGGRRIRTPTGVRTRPTSDRVREALFSAIDAAHGSIVGLAFLDLYAGSGAVGLEALSRGASVATLVERDRRTASLIRDNATSLALPAHVVTSTVSRLLAAPARSAYDIAFLDPPYSLAVTDVVDDLTALCRNRWLTANAILVVERPSRDDPFPWPKGTVAVRSRRYGETTLWYGHATGTTTAA